jgi:hypothetical protein
MMMVDTIQSRRAVGKHVQYRIVPVTRYIVTRYESEVHESGMGSGSSGSTQLTGEYQNENMAYEVGYALCKAEHDRLGYPPDDERIQYPRQSIPSEMVQNLVR